VKVVRLHGSRDLRVVDEPSPRPGPGEELVRVGAVGICGSDLHWYLESGIGDTTLARPLVLGHEASGTIATGPRAGERVAIDPAIPCETCEPCRAGHQNVCRQIRFAGDSPTDGLLRELAAWPASSLVPVPGSLSDDDVAMLEPLGIAIHAVRLGGVQAGQRIGVFGCGPIGLLIVQLARLAGASTIVATDVLPHRVEAARAAGATEATLVDGGEERDRLLAATDGHGVDVAFEAAGEQDPVETAIALAAPLGTVVIVGIPAVDRTSFSASTARRKGLTIKLSRRMNRAYPGAISLAAGGLVDLRSIVTASYPLARIDDAFATAARREGLKVVVRASA
jgi:L-iditol 2-dehydrogenase